MRNWPKTSLLTAFSCLFMGVSYGWFLGWVMQDLWLPMRAWIGLTVAAGLTAMFEFTISDGLRARELDVKRWVRYRRILRLFEAPGAGLAIGGFLAAWTTRKFGYPDHVWASEVDGIRATAQALVMAGVVIGFISGIAVNARERKTVWPEWHHLYGSN